MTNKPTEAISFAWTPGAGAYKFYPPYVNLTGNRLAVRGLEKSDHNGSFHPGEYVVVELPEDAIAELRAALRSSAPQEPVADDDAEWLLNYADSVLDGSVMGVREAKRLKEIAARIQVSNGGGPSPHQRDDRH